VAGRISRPRDEMRGCGPWYMGFPPMAAGFFRGPDFTVRGHVHLVGILSACLGTEQNTGHPHHEGNARGDCVVSTSLLRRAHFTERFHTSDKLSPALPG